MAICVTRPQWVKTYISASPVYIRNPNLVITAPADVLVPNGARPSAGTVLNTMLEVSSSTCLWLFRCLLSFWWQDDGIQNGRWDLRNLVGVLVLISSTLEHTPDSSVRDNMKSSRSQRTPMRHALHIKLIHSITLPLKPRSDAIIRTEHWLSWDMQ